MKKVKIAVSVGDLNGIGIELIFKNHKKISKICTPIYCINKNLLKQSSKFLETKIPKNFKIFQTKGDFTISPSKLCEDSGRYSFNSFCDAIKLVEQKNADAIVTLPINKESWSKANIEYKGHTDFLKNYFKKDAIMMLGCKKMFVALYTEHIPLKEVAQTCKKVDKLSSFLINFYNCVRPKNKVALLGLNPHASDNGVLGDEETFIKRAIDITHKKLQKNIFTQPLVPDTAFTKQNRKKYKYYIAMYHDQGLIPLKALYFDESINISLNLPIIRTSVDHGTAFDIAYKNKANSKSYLNAIKEAIKLVKKNENTPSLL